MVPTSFEAIILLHSFSVVSSPVKCVGRKIAQVYTTGTLVGLFAIPVCQLWTIQFKKARWHSPSSLIALYMWYDVSQVHFLIL